MKVYFLKLINKKHGSSWQLAMNILPKKSWHVRNKDNIARVRRDEENARVEEEKLTKRAALAEQEARTKLLRERVKSDAQSSAIAVSTSIVPCDNSEPRHVNLFYKEETGFGGATTNAEYEAEKKAEQEKKEKALGVLKYLAQSANEDPHPWYLQKDKERTEKLQRWHKNSLDNDRKSKLDPLVKMNAFLDQTKQSESQKKEKRKKEKKHCKEKYKEGKKTIDELRAERLKREKEERFRAEKLILEQKEGKSSKAENDPYKQQYYSQYNPDLAKKPKWNRRNQPY